MKRVLCAILALLTFLSLASTAWADEPKSEIIGEETIDGGDTELLLSMVAGTLQISGNISQDTVLDRTDVVYQLQSDLNIKSGVTLTVDNGVKIDGNGYSINVYGAIDANGATFERASIYARNTGYTPCTISFKNCTIMGGRFLDPTGDSEHAYISMSGNFFQNIRGYMYIWYPADSIYIERNIFDQCGGICVGSDHDVYIRNNVFSNMTTDYAVQDWAQYGGSMCYVEKNSFYGTGIAVSLEYDSSKMYAVNNYWGTTDESAIASRVRDGNSDYSISNTIEYIPFLTEPDADTPAFNVPTLSGWQLKYGRWCYLDSNGNSLRNKWIHLANDWYYVDQFGWRLENNWLKASGKWYYFDWNGKMVTGSKSINGQTYLFDSNGVMLSGKWIQDENNWYYLNGNGILTTGWQKISNKWYYFDESGVMLTGTQVIDGKTYVFNASGVMQASKWIQQGSDWYYLTGSGANAVGWQKVGSTWYYFDASGVMLTGKQSIDGEIYFFNASGAMQEGKWVQDGSDWYYLASSGAAYRSKWLKSGGKWYWFDENGLMLAGTSREIGGNVYDFNASGVCTNP